MRKDPEDDHDLLFSRNITASSQASVGLEPPNQAVEDGLGHAKEMLELVRRAAENGSLDHHGIEACCGLRALRLPGGRKSIDGSHHGCGNGDLAAARAARAVTWSHGNRG